MQDEQGFWLSMSTPLIVVAGLISKTPTAPPFLLSRRLPEAHLGGYWEFPGGKLERGESPEVALRREIKEELGIEVEVGDIFAVGHHEYPTKTYYRFCPDSFCRGHNRCHGDKDCLSRLAGQSS